MIKRKKREDADKKKKKGRAKIKNPATSDKKLRNPKAEYLVVPSESRSLPWCLYNEDENKTEYPGTATDFIIRNLVAEFKTLTGQKIVDILCLHLEETFSLETIFSSSTNPHLHQVISSFVRVSKHNSLSFSISAMLLWREYQFTTSAKEKFKHSALTQGGSIVATAPKQPKDPQNILDERHTLVIDHIFVTTVLALLDAQSQVQIKDPQLEKLLTVTIEQCQFYGKTASALVENKRELFNLFALVLGVLSKTYFNMVTDKIWNGVSSMLTSHRLKTQALSRIEALKHIRLDVSDQLGVNETLAFLSSYCSVLKSSKLNKESRLVLSQSTCAMLESVAAQPLNEEVDYMELHRLLVDLYNTFSASKRKPRDIHVQTWYPLLSALLASADEKFFLAQWMELCTSMGRPLREKNLRPFLLQSLRLLVRTYCSKFSKDDPKLAATLDQIRDLVFPSKISKTTITFQGESVSTLELFVDIIIAIAKRDLDYSMRKIVFEFIRADRLRGDSQPEKVFIAIRAIFGIHDFITTQNSLIPASDTTRPKYDMDEYMPSICDFISQLLQSLDGIFGNWLLYNQSRSVYDLLQREKLNSQSFILFRNCISHIPPILPSGFNEGELVALLSRYLVHIDNEIRDRAWSVLSSLMKNCETHRAHIIYGMSKFLLQIPDLKPGIICSVMQKLLKMINYWIYTSNSRPSSEVGIHPTKIDLALSYEIEGIGLLFLCNSHTEVRDLALEILQGIRKLAQPNSEVLPDAINLPPTRIVGIMEESGDEIRRNLENDFRFGVDVPFPEELTYVSFKTIAVSKHQMCWSYCLAQIVQLASELCPPVVDSIRRVFASRIEEMSKTGVSNEQEGVLSLWRNYITVACIITKDPQEAKELFSILQTYLKLESHRETVIFAFQRANIDIVEAIIDTLKTYETESGAKKAKKRDRIRNDVGNIFCVLSERFTPGFLHSHEKIRNYVLHFIHESISYLSDGTLEDTVVSRYYFCTIVRNVALQLSEEFDQKEMNLDADLRHRLFKLFTQWTHVGGPDPVPSEATAKKKKWNPSVFEQIFFKMQEQACSATAAVLRGVPFTDKTITVDDPVLVWVRHMRKSERKELCAISVEALEYYIDANQQNEELCNIALDHCYCSEKDVADAYFLAIVEVYKKGGTMVSCSSPILFHLILFQLGNSNMTIRRFSIQLLQILAFRKDEENWATCYSPPAVDGFLFEVYQTTQLDLSRRLANDYPELTFAFFNEFVFRLDSADSLHQKLMLSYLIAWVKKMVLSTLDSDSLAVFLKNMFWVTLKYNGDPHHFTHLVQVWETLAGSDPDNIPMIIDYTLSLGVSKRNPMFVQLAKRVVIFLSHTNSKTSIDTLVNELSTIGTKLRLSRQLFSFTKPLSESSDASTDPSDGKTNSHRFDPFMLELKNSNLLPPARGHLALLLLTELSFLPSLAEELSPHLPILLQQVFLGLDNGNHLVFGHCRLLLQNMIVMLVLREQQNTPEFQENDLLIDAMLLIDFLKSKENIPFWDREDISHSNIHTPSADQLCSLVGQVIDVLIDKYPDLRENWGSEALSWAISCPDYHWRCRSFQIYRALNPIATPEILHDMLSALVKWLPSEDDGCGIELEILYSLQVIASSANTNRLVLFNTLFWSAVALLHSDFDVIYVQAITLLGIILERISFHDKAVQHVFLASRPKVWATRFLGIQPMLLKGLLSPVTEPLTIEIIIKISELPLNEIFHPDPTRLLTTILALQPWLCIHCGDQLIHRKCQLAANYLSKACDEAKLDELSQVYSRVPSEQSSIGVFLVDWCNAFARSFFPEYGIFTFMMITELLHNGPIKYHRAILYIFHLLVKCTDINNKKFNPRIPQWFGSVSQFVCSEIWKEALVGLESAVEQAPLDSEQIDIESLRPFRLYRKVPSFSNDIGDGNLCAANCLENVLAFGETSAKSENMISPRAFSKFFSEDDMLQEQDFVHRPPVEEESESGEEFEDSIEEEIHVSSTPNVYGHADINGFGLLDNGPDFGGMGGAGFPSFTGFDDILSDLHKETGEGGSDLDSLTNSYDNLNPNT